MGRPKIHAGDTVKIIFRVPCDLRQRLKMRAAELNVSMQTLFVEIVEEGLKKNLPPHFYTSTSNEDGALDC